MAAHYNHYYLQEKIMGKLLFSLLCAVFLFATTAIAAVNVNKSSVSDIAKIKGIGPVKAQAIVDYRTKNGPFTSVADLKKVKGIGEKTIEKIGKDISVDK